MPTFYVGYRNVLKGRSANVTNFYTGKVGEYSNWDLMHKSHVLDGAPDRDVTPGAGLYPHALQLTGMFRGTLFYKYPLANPGMKTSLYDFYRGRYQTWAYNGVRPAFPAGYGHAPFRDPDLYYGSLGYNWYGLSNLKEPALGNVGHPIEAYGARYAFFGPTKPYIHKGVSTPKSEPMTNPGHPLWGPSLVADKMPSDYGQTAPARTTTEHYGFEHTQEWFGVPSAQAL